MQAGDYDRMSDERPEGGVKSVQVTLDVLEAVAAAPSEIGVSELALRLGLTKGTIFRHLQTLLKRGYLTQNSATARYGLGMRLHVLGQMAYSRIDLLSASEPVMRQLRDDLGLTVNLAGFGPRGVMILSTLLGTSPLEIGVRVGTEMPFHATSQGRIALAFSRRPLMATLRRQKLAPLTERTVCDPDELEREVGLTRERGWAGASEQTVLGVNAISVPIFDSTSDGIAALTLVGSIQFLRPLPDAPQLEALARAGERISAHLGYREHHRRPHARADCETGTIPSGSSGS
jgi:DNA-binding IclR family transcriptional regulator